MRSLGERQSWDLTRGLPNNELQLTKVKAVKPHEGTSCHHAARLGRLSQLNSVLGTPGGILVEWEKRLTRLVLFYGMTAEPEDPFFLYEASQPQASEWPPSLPFSAALEKVYRICSTGRFGGIDRLLPLPEAALWTTRYIETGRDYDTRGDVLCAGRHIVFAMDADGTPWILDALTGRVASFYFKGGDWQEPSYPSVDVFMEAMLSSAGHGEDWAAAARGIFQEGA
jgi:hypothetical protein